MTNHDEGGLSNFLLRYVGSLNCWAIHWFVIFASTYSMTLKDYCRAETSMSIQWDFSSTMLGVVLLTLHLHLSNIIYVFKISK